MAMVDEFVLLTYVQFEKNGFQNRYQIRGKWVTKPVWQETQYIHFKDYVGLESDKNRPYGGVEGGSLIKINYLWIKAIKDTLGIKTILSYERPLFFKEEKPYKWDATNHLIKILQEKDADVYVTNPEAKDKYLDEGKIKKAGFDIEYCKVPNHLKRHTFEIFEDFGIVGAMKMLPKRKCKV